MSSETDDIFLKASVDPLLTYRGLKSEGMGKGHSHVDFFTTRPHVKAHKRTQDWRRCKDLWFSLPGPRWPLWIGCRVQHQSRCGAGNMTPIIDVALGDRQSATSNLPICASCWVQDSKSSHTASGVIGSMILANFASFDWRKCIREFICHTKVYNKSLWLDNNLSVSNLSVKVGLICGWLQLEWCSLPVTTPLNCRSRDMPYLHLSLPFIAPTLYV